MSELVIAEKNDLVNIANEVRRLTGQTEGLNLQEMQTELQSIDNQPDWNQNDPNAKDYIKNRPGGYVIPPSVEITWDGDTTGKETMDLGQGLIMVKIAEEAPPIEKFAVRSDVATFTKVSGPSYAATITADLTDINNNTETKQLPIELQEIDGFWIGNGQNTIGNGQITIVIGVVADHASVDGNTLSKGLWVSVWEEAIQ